MTPGARPNGHVPESSAHTGNDRRVRQSSSVLCTSVPPQKWKQYALSGLKCFQDELHSKVPFTPFKRVTRELRMAQGPFAPLGTFGSGLHSHSADEGSGVQGFSSCGPQVTLIYGMDRLAAGARCLRPLSGGHR